MICFDTVQTRGKSQVIKRIQVAVCHQLMVNRADQFSIRRRIIRIFSVYPNKIELIGFQCSGENFQQSAFTDSVITLKNRTITRFQVQ